MQELQRLTLVLVQALDHDVEQVAVRQFDAVAGLQQCGQATLVPGLGLAELVRELGVVGVGLELAEALQVGDPAVADGVVDEPGQLAVGQPHEAARRDAVGDVGELVRPERGEVGQHVVAQQLGVQLGDAVDLGASDGGEVRHAHTLLGVFGDHRHAAGADLVAGEGLADLLEELVVDPVDDLQVARQQAAEQLHRPDLQRLGQQGVAGVGEALPGDRPGLVPVEALLVHEDAHQLGHRDHRVGVVELEHDPLRQVAKVEALLQLIVEEIADRAGHEEVLLLEAQLLALRRRVLGVEDLGDVLGEGLRAGRLGVVAGVEDLQVEALGRLGAPQPQGVDDAVAEARDHVVVGDAEHVPSGDPARALDAVLVDVLLGVTAEVHLDGGLRVRELPRGAQPQPRVRALDLAAVLVEGLPEDAVLVADAVADAGHVHGGQRVDEAGGQPAETAVAQPGLDLLRAQGGQIQTAELKALLGDLAEVRRHQRVAELAAQQVLGRQVADGLGLGLTGLAARLEPAGHEVVLHGAGEGEVLVVDAGL